LTHPLQVLLVEDNDLAADYLTRLLGMTELACHVLRVETLADAVDALATLRLDAVLLDLQLPDSRGIGTVDQVMRAPTVPPVVIVLTGGADEDQAREALRRGVQAYVDKLDLSTDQVTTGRRVPPAQRLKTILLDAMARAEGVRAQYLALMRTVGREQGQGRG
jgi:CheY-like chemotaxis protein